MFVCEWKILDIRLTLNLFQRALVWNRQIFMWEILWTSFSSHKITISVSIRQIFPTNSFLPSWILCHLEEEKSSSSPNTKKYFAILYSLQIDLGTFKQFFLWYWNWSYFQVDEQFGKTLNFCTSTLSLVFKAAWGQKLVLAMLEQWLLPIHFPPHQKLKFQTLRGRKILQLFGKSIS